MEGPDAESGPFLFVISAVIGIRDIGVDQFCAIEIGVDCRFPSEGEALGVISPDPAAVFRELDSGGVILNVENGDYFQLNATGRIIWEALADGAERDDLVERLTATFDLGSEQAEADVDHFLSELGERSLIRETN